MFDWDDGNTDHIVNHDVTPEEAEEALTDRHRVGMSVYNAGNERRWGVIGATEDGRILAIVYTKRSGLTRVIMARNANQAERRRYEK